MILQKTKHVCIQVLQGSVFSTKLTLKLLKWVLCKDIVSDGFAETHLSAYSGYQRLFSCSDLPQITRPYVSSIFAALSSHESVPRENLW